MKDNITIREWVRNREVHGIATFSYEDVRDAFPALSSQVIRNNLSRLIKQGVVASVYKGFYVIIPPQYAAKGVVPEAYYIEHLMKYLGRPYYVCLLSAAEQYGAAHQRSQLFFVATTLPKINKVRNENSRLSFIFRNDIPEQFLHTKNSETGVITFSSPELTAVDLVQYNKRVGGLNRAATVLAELVEQTDFTVIDRSFVDYVSMSSIQRLGYILDEVLEEREQADALYRRVIELGLNFSPAPLSTQHDRVGCETDKKWKVIINTSIEPDEV